MAEKPFLVSLADTAGMIEAMRQEMAEIEAQRSTLADRANDLTNKVSALNALRQAHALPPV